MREELLKIINHYGVMPQLKYFQSEVFELNEAMIFYENEKRYCDDIADEAYIKTLKNHIAEEIADVCVMLREFMEYYDISQDEISIIMEYKINRQIKRIKEELSK